MEHLLQSVVFLVLMQTRIYSPACAAGTQWTFVVDGETAPTASSWLDQGDAPSLTPGAAVRSARAFLQKMACAAPDWEVDQIALRRIGGSPPTWLYIVTFIQALHAPPGSQAGSVLRHQVEVPVLLNGFVPNLSAPAGPRRK